MLLTFAISRNGKLIYSSVDMMPILRLHLTLTLYGYRCTMAGGMLSSETGDRYQKMIICATLIRMTKTRFLRCLSSLGRALVYSYWFIDVNAGGTGGIGRFVHLVICLVCVKSALWYPIELFSFPLLASVYIAYINSMSLFGGFLNKRQLATPPFNCIFN